MFKLFNKLKGLARDESGATIVEYGVALLIVTAISATVLTDLGSNVASNFSDAELRTD